MRIINDNKLFVWAVSVALLFFGFWEISGEAQDRLDPYILLFIGVVKQVIVLLMLFFTTKWAWRAIGVMSVMQGVALVYLAAAWGRFDPAVSMTAYETMIDLGRSFLVVGLIPLLIGVLNYGWAATSMGVKRRRHSAANGDLWGLPVEETRNQRDKRQDARQDRQDVREVGQDIRAVGQDKRGWEMSKESFKQEVRTSKINDREDAVERREEDADIQAASNDFTLYLRDKRSSPSTDCEGGDKK